MIATTTDTVESEYHETDIVIPDAINCTRPDAFTMLPNAIARDPNLSAKAKGILWLLLSNRKGWKSCCSTIVSMMADGVASVRSGLLELERNGYLLRIRYRDKTTKSMRGSFWAYTNRPGEFDLEDAIAVLEEHGMEPVQPGVLRKKRRDTADEPTCRFSTCGFSTCGFSTCGEPTISFPTGRKPTGRKPNGNNTNSKNTKEKNIYTPSSKKNGGEERIELPISSTLPRIERTRTIPPRTGTDASTPDTSALVSRTNASPSTQSESLPLLRTEAETPSASIDKHLRAAKRIHRHWLKVAGHIHKARWTPTLEQVMRQALRKWSATQIMEAIDHYVDVCNRNGYYNHRWTLGNFLKQRNGAPRFAEGLDDIYDGDLWRNYLENTNDDESFHANGDSNAPPEELIQDKLGEDLGPVFIRQVFEPAADLLSTTDLVDENQLAQALLTMYDKIGEEQSKHNLPDDLLRLGYSPIRILSSYVEWLEAQEWMSNKGLRLFRTHSNPFRGNFCSQLAKEIDSLQRDPLTGKSALSSRR